MTNQKCHESSLLVAGSPVSFGWMARANSGSAITRSPLQSRIYHETWTTTCISLISAPDFSSSQARDLNSKGCYFS